MLGALRGCGPPLGLRRPDVANKRSVSAIRRRNQAARAQATPPAGDGLAANGSGSAVATLEPPGNEAPPPASATATAASSTPAAQESAAVAAWSGAWSKQWYAVCAVSDLDASKPQPFELLGKQLVIWRAADGAWGCLEDRCPHRAVPLSEGKVWSDGTLMCSYHGWRFKQDGACTSIPQASSADAEAVAAASRRACAVAHPITERQGMLFVWGEGGLEAEAESRRVPPPVCPLTEETRSQGRDVLTMTPHYTRDLPYSFDSLVENVVDPAHVPFSHHGVMGNRDSQKHGMWDMERVSDLAVRWQTGFGEVTTTYHPPAFVQYSTKNKRGGRSAMSFWFTPLSPGRSRITLHLITANPELAPLPFKLLASLPPWVDHIRTRSAVFDGDNVFLNGQDRILAEAGQQEEGASWRKLYYMPTPADTLVAAYRNWLDTLGGGGPFGSLADPTSPAAKAAAAVAAAAAAAALPPTGNKDSRRQLLDRYHQHTVHCASCRNALQKVTLLRRVAAVAATVAAAACLLPFLTLLNPAVTAAAASAAGSAGTGGAASLAAAAGAAWLPGVLAAVLCATWLLLGKLRNQFLFVDYVHNEK
ncbi:hypothetical protein ABPG77_010578 [Micractinium sp. CCAP 211/92]